MSLLRFSLVYALLINLIAALLMWIDKQLARKRMYRIPEKTLLSFAILGGGIGATLAMYLCHHKTRHLIFAVGLPLISALQVTLAVCWIWHQT